ncbi:MAG: methylamine utilization protein [Pseudoxanthomonas sp.]
MPHPPGTHAISFSWRGLCLLWLACAALSNPALAVELAVSTSGGGMPLGEAVVSLKPTRDGALPAGAGTRAVMDQRGSQFTPRVLVVQAGTSVAFPNSDQIQHQVYSFSAIKRFELPLYAGKQVGPIRFDQPGVAVLGCNIHDWMIGYVVVVDTPYFAKSDAQGNLVIDAPPGVYTLQAWHERQTGAPHEQSITLVAGKRQSIMLALGVKAEAASRPGNDRLKALQEKFRRIKPAA